MKLQSWCGKESPCDWGEDGMCDVCSTVDRLAQATRLLKQWNEWLESDTSVNLTPGGMTRLFLAKNHLCEGCDWEGKARLADGLFGMDGTPLCNDHLHQAEMNYESAVSFSDALRNEANALIAKGHAAERDGDLEEAEFYYAQARQLWQLRRE